ncbi:MAG: DNA repair protein [Coriobacteriaceae bacterium]|uniref:Y-family DNA polymerase n=1 Tax=Tractidigestivibacter sp. TaxID=2847320 RepID=UPI002A837B28|nr:DNA repair protein [Tractidigestivibacter sp.]MCI6843682.1 DNA repair protein [Coriobacteriaceae bacterium]MDY4534103.1 DNA repair protein [Tractidigestivibacter sp.]
MADAPAACAPKRQYLCVDLKSFYASVECVERGLDPLAARLVVADPSRTEKTICLAVSPAMKALGVRNRCRAFEIPQAIDYVMVPPRMALYMERSCDVYAVYLRWIAPEDIHVYSIDEAFMDITGYLGLYGCTARELGERIREDVARTTGIPATCGLGTNLYLAKVALDITAKHSGDFFGELDEQTYRATLWNHRPITDFWRVGPGISERLAAMGIHTMGQVATYPAEPLYREFGVDAEILIDHAWGVEPVTMADIKAYRPGSHSVSTAQVLGRNRDFAGARIIAREMADALALDLVEQRLVASGVSLYVGYDLSSEERAGIRDRSDPRAWYRAVASAGGGERLLVPTSSREQILAAATRVFDASVDRSRPVHRLGLTATGVLPEGAPGVQGSLFATPEADARERRRQEAVSAVRHKFGKNSLLKGVDLLPEATARERNLQIGGHRSGE